MRARLQQTRTPRPTRRPALRTRTTLAFAALAALVAACGTNAATVEDGGKSDAKNDASGSHDSKTGPLRGHEGGGDGAGAADACPSVKKQAQKVPLDLVLAIDNSFSMQFENKWTNLSAALDAFVDDPASAGLDFGIQFFPLRQLCAAGAYQALTVPVGPQATVAPLIKAAIAARKMSGGTPTVPVLQGLVAYLQANVEPGHKPVIVMATDGVPDFSCAATPDGGMQNSLTNAEAVAAAAFAGTPSIPLFVIGVGSDLTPLNGLAAAGGTGAATLINVGADAGNPEQAFIQALNAIRQQAIPCNFALPTGGVDPTATNVAYTSGSGTTTNEMYVGSETSCTKAPTDGWYFDNPTMPTQVILCSGACAIVKADPGAEVDVFLGCPRVGPP